MFRLLRLISYPQLRASWGRTALVIGGAATGVTLIVAINIINASILTNFRRTIDLAAGPAELEVTLGLGEVGFPDAAVEVVRADRDVLAAVPLVHGTVSLADTPADTLQLFGADLLTEDALGRYEVVVAGERRQVAEALADTHSILVTSAFAKRRGLSIGDALSLSTPRGVASFTIRGLLDAKGVASAFGDTLAVMDLPSAQRFLAKDGAVDQIDVIIKADGDLGAIRDRLQRALPNLTVARPVQRGEEYDRVLGSFQAMLTGLSLLCLVAGVFIIYNTTSTAVLHRALAMAALRLAGAESSQLFWLLVAEAFILGVVGALLGIPIGIGLAWLLSGAVADSMGVIFQLRFPLQGLAVDGREQVLIGLLGVIATVFASSFAARRIAKMDPLDVIRSDATAIHARVAVSRLVAWWIVMLVISAAALVIEVRTQSILWGNIGSTLWNSSVLVIAIPVVTWLAGSLSSILPRMFAAEGRIAASSLFRSPTRTGVTAAAVALVLTIGVTVSSLSYSHRRSVERYFNGGFLTSDLMVSAVATEGGWLEAPIPEELIAEIAALPGVRSAEAFRVFPGYMFRGVRVALGGGSNGFFEVSRYPPGWYLEGDPQAAGAAIQESRGVNISTSLSDRFAIHVGDDVDLETPTGRLTLPIVGVVPDYMSDRGSIIMNRRILVDRWGDHALNRIHVFVEKDASPEQVGSAIRERLGDRYRLKILSVHELVKYHDDYVKRAFGLTDAIQLLVVVVTIAGILDLLTSSIVERRRELALWRVMGADDRAVRRSVIIESATIGMLGAALGTAVGFITAWIWVGINFRYLLGYYLEYHFAVTSAVWYVILVIGMTVLAGSAAAAQATRQSILDGIRKD